MLPYIYSIRLGSGLYLSLQIRLLLYVYIGTNPDPHLCLAPRHHQPAGEHGADVVAAQTHAVDAVPGLDGVDGGVVELLAGALEDGVDAGVGVVHQQVQAARLLSSDLGKQSLNI